GHRADVRDLTGVIDVVTTGWLAVLVIVVGGRKGEMRSGAAVLVIARHDRAWKRGDQPQKHAEDEKPAEHFSHDWLPSSIAARPCVSRPLGPRSAYYVAFANWTVQYRERGGPGLRANGAHLRRLPGAARQR